jgi:hypothetical protein
MVHDYTAMSVPARFPEAGNSLRHEVTEQLIDHVRRKIVILRHQASCIILLNHKVKRGAADGKILTSPHG